MHYLDYTGAYAHGYLDVSLITLGKTQLEFRVRSQRIAKSTPSIFKGTLNLGHNPATEIWLANQDQEKPIKEGLQCNAT